MPAATEVAAGGREPELADVGAVAVDRAGFWQVPLPRTPALAVLVRCPESDLAQVLDVLLDNAVKYGGAVRVSLGADRAAGVGKLLAEMRTLRLVGAALPVADQHGQGG